MRTSTLPVPLLSLLFACALLASGCDSGGETEARWEVALDGLPGALFSISGTAADDVWVVGGDRDDGQGPTLLHWDGSRWEYVDSGASSGNLLWVHTFADGSVVAAGSDGLIVRGSASEGFAPMATPGSREVWGVWGESPERMWAVGGLVTGTSGFVWRYENGAWSEVALEAGLPTPTAWFKVWGTSDSDVWFCGDGGALMHWDGERFAAVESGTGRRLLTIHGREDGSLVTAVGGQFTATLVASIDGGPFEDVTPAGDPPLQPFGVFHRGREAYAVGMQGVVLHDDGSGWSVVDTGLAFGDDLHGVWIDPDGGVWAGGGLIIAPPYRDGTLLYYGRNPPASSIE